LLHGINAGILSCEGRRKGSRSGWANWAATTTAFSNLKDVFIARRFDQRSVVVA
jgi:hypothetical protein